MRIAIITANTAIYRQTEPDKAGGVIRQIAEDEGMEIVFQQALPNDRKVLSTVFQRIADNQVADLILTSGGAGCGPEDFTPEATLDVVDRQVAGIPEGIRAHLSTVTKRAVLNRCVAGIRGNVLIVNLPGKAGAVKESLTYILPEVMHAVDVIQGRA